MHRATRRVHAPTVCDWQLIKISTSYLKGTKNVNFQLGQKQPQQIISVQLSSASDANFSGDKLTRKSVCGGIFRVGDMIVV